jgi:DNA-binding NtrC family response regulator
LDTGPLHLPSFDAVNPVGLWRRVLQPGAHARGRSQETRRAGCAAAGPFPIAGGAHGRHIGVVDDDASIRRAVARLLRVAGFDVTVFRSGEDLLTWDGIASLDCLILDVHLDGLTGFAVGERVATSWPGMPVIFITANDDVGSGESTSRGRHLVLLKPFDEHTLMGAIDTAVQGARPPGSPRATS